MTIVRNALFIGCMLIGLGLPPASADEREGVSPAELTIDWIDLKNRKMVAGDSTVILSPGLRVYSADGRLMSVESLKQGMKVTFEAIQLPNATRPVVREVRVVSQR